MTPFVAHEVVTEDADDAADEVLQLRAVEIAIGTEDDRADSIVVMMVGMGEEAGLDLQRGVEVEAADIEQIVQRHAAEMHGML